MGGVEVRSGRNTMSGSYSHGELVWKAVGSRWRFLHRVSCRRGRTTRLRCEGVRGADRREGWGPRELGLTECRRRNHTYGTGWSIKIGEEGEGLGGGGWGGV